MKIFSKGTSLLAAGILFSGCAALFGWDIHAPGLISEAFYTDIRPAPYRVALYLPDELIHYQSKNKGGRLADPQTYYVGEALTTMTIEGFQQGFQEFIFLEAEPHSKIMRAYGIPYLVTIRPKEFLNRVGLKGQAVGWVTEVEILDADLKSLAVYEAKGISDARRVFAKKGGPELNLNAAIENNVRVTVQFLQDYLARQGNA